MAEIIGLSVKDRELLQTLLNDRRRILEPSPRRENEEDPFHSSDVFFAKPPQGGIPGLQKSSSSISVSDIPGFATCEIYWIDHTGTADPTFSRVDVPDKIVYNYGPAIPPDTEWVLVQRTRNGNWVAIRSTAATPSSSVGICPCTCIQSGDVTECGQTTTSIWSVYLSEIRFNEPCGYVILPANDHQLTYVPLSNYWVKNIKPELLAFYSDGTPYTIPSVGITATMIFRCNESGYTTLTIQWSDNIVPCP